MVFKILWLFPAAALLSSWRSGHRRLAASIVLTTFCAACQLLFAHDSSRLLTLGFMAMISSLVHLFEVGPFGFRNWASAVVVLNLLVPQLYTSARTVIRLHSLPESIVLRLLGVDYPAP